jgi:hypothetical protein
MTNDRSAIPDAPTENFSGERWAELTQPLRAYEHVFRRLAAEHRSELIGSSRWPEVRFRRRSLMLVNEVRLSLVADTAGSRVPEWAVRIVRYARFPPILAKQRSVEETARFTDYVLRGDTGLIETSIAAALRRPT